MRQIVLDTETTGIKVEEGHRVIEIGCVELINRKLTGAYFHQYINPTRAVDPGAFAVHGLSNQFLEDKPLFEIISETFVEFVSGAELIIHNAPFDLGFLNNELKLTRKHKSLNELCLVIDTLQLARQLHVGQRNSLDALCKRYGIDNSKREFHGALLDAHLLAQVYLAMTGGQGSFFDSQELQSESLDLSIKPELQTTIKDYHFIVHAADENESAEHEKYLEEMRKQGKCLWSI